MTRNRIRIGAILLASAMAVAAPMAAQARGGGGGGGGHGGGGGGGHFGGGGGGMHFGGGGGGMHFGGGHFGGMHFGGGHFGGLRLGGMHLGGFSRHAFHAGGRGFHGGRSFANLHEHGLRSAERGGERGLRGEREGERGLRGERAGERGLRGERGQRFAHNGFRNFHRFRGLYGWAGPLFWPYAYSDIYCDVFWGFGGYGCADPYWSYGYGDPFWDYGYSDIYGGLFSPFGFGDLAGYQASAQGGGRTRRGRAAEDVASIPAGQPPAAVSGELTQMCGDDTREVAGWPIDLIQKLITPNDRQRMALDDLANASVKAAQVIKTACPTRVAYTPTGRLASMQQRVEGMMQAVDVVRGPLDTFYGTLTDEQKAQLNAANQSTEQQNARSRGSLTQNCTATNAATQWPGSQIEKAVRPNEAQLAKLRALQDAAAQAAQQLAASCPSDMPATPPARLGAVAKRLDVMLQSVKNVRVALDDFYGSLNDEQKAQFNLIGQPRTAQRQG
jgi:hypothetical protein